MRIPFPVHIPMKFVVAFAVAMAAAQLAEGTGPYFVLCAFLFNLLTGFGFNLAGGFSHVSGAYIFFFATLTATVGWLVKIFLGEAADSNLIVPDKTVTVYLGTLIAMIVALMASRKLTPKRSLLGNFLTADNARASAVGCTVVGLALLLANAAIPHQPGDLVSALVLVNPWSLLAIIIAVQDEIRRSGGTRSLNAVAVIAGSSVFVINGLIGYSKEGMFEPIVCYLAAAAAQGYQFSIRQVAAGVLGCYFLLHFMVPYSQYGRNVRLNTAPSFAQFSGNISSAIAQLSDLEGTRESYLATAEVALLKTDAGYGHYFNQDQGLFERLHMLGPDDALIDATDQGRSQYGLAPLWYAVEDIVPHFLWRDKPNAAYGNLYSHEILYYSGEDFTTGISFSPGGEAYHAAKWYGVFLVAPLVFFATFLVFDTLCGDLRRTPWGLLAVAVFAQIAPEGMLTGSIGTIWKFGLAIVAAAYFCEHVMPILGGLLVGPQKRRIAEDVG